jgi:hypothetical protein
MKPKINNLSKPHNNPTHSTSKINSKKSNSILKYTELKKQLINLQTAAHKPPNHCSNSSNFNPKLFLFIHSQKNNRTQQEKQENALIYVNKHFSKALSRVVHKIQTKTREGNRATMLVFRLKRERLFRC